MATAWRQAALAQPQCAVHRDYQSRNLMLLDDGELRAAMAEAARVRALQRFSRERIVEGLGVFYAQVFAQGEKA